MITIKDIAKKAQVSTATVSYVLNNNGKISPETRDKVLKVVEELNYRTNNLAKGLRTNKTNTIGIIAEDITVFNTPKIIDGINKYVEEHGYHIILSNIRLYNLIGNEYNKIKEKKNVIDEVVNVLLSRQIDGLIYIGAHNRDLTGIINNINIPIVYSYGYISGDYNFSVNYDDRLAAYEATSYLINLGHDKIAVISGLIDSRPSHERFQGYQQALMDHNLAFNPMHIKIGDWEYDSGYQLGSELLELPQPPTAIFAFNDLMAAGMVDAAEAKGLNVPGEISVIGFDDREFSSFHKPKLTTIKLPLVEMGKKSAEILLNLIEDEGGKEQKDIRLECKLISRESVGTINK